MAKMNEQLSADEVKAFAANIDKFEKEIEAEEQRGDEKRDWRVARVGDVGSDSWNMSVQEIELELEKLRARKASKTEIAKVKRLKELAGIAKPHVKSLALKQAKRRSKKL